jgi:protease IV
MDIYPNVKKNYMLRNQYQKIVINITKGLLMTLFELIKSIVITIIFLCIAPYLIESIKKQYIPLLEPRTNIAIVHIAQQLHNSYPALEQLHSFFKDPLIKGIVIKIDCANAAAGTSQTIFHDIRQLKKEYPKPTIALVENTCISGAYLIASACDYIIAPESALIGNIGPSFNAHSLKQVADEKSNLQNIDHESYQQLTKQIALGRKLSLTTTANWAEGKVFTGTQALALGLINEIGSLCTVIKVIKEKALIEDEIQWIEQKNDIFSLNSFRSLSLLGSPQK